MNVFSSAGWLEILDSVTAAGLLFRIHLYRNNHVPVFTDTIADYTEANFSGYGSSILLAWGAAFVNGSNQGEIDAVAVAWSHNGGGTGNLIYGVYVTDAGSGLVYAERFPAPVSMTTAADGISYIPRTTLINQ